MWLEEIEQFSCPGRESWRRRVRQSPFHLVSAAGHRSRHRGLGSLTGNASVTWEFVKVPTNSPGSAPSITDSTASLTETIRCPRFKKRWNAWLERVLFMP